MMSVTPLLTQEMFSEKKTALHPVPIRRNKKKETIVAITYKWILTRRTKHLYKTTGLMRTARCGLVRQMVRISLTVFQHVA